MRIKMLVGVLNSGYDRVKAISMSRMVKDPMSSITAQ